MAKVWSILVALILSQLSGNQVHRIPTNREFISELFDSLFSRIEQLPDTLNILVESSDTALKALAEERAYMMLSKRKIMLKEDSQNDLLIRITGFSLSFPVATKEKLFSERVIERRAYAKIFVGINKGFKAYEDEMELKDRFPASSIDYVNSFFPFVAYPEKRSFKYYLWEPVIIAIFTVAFAYIFFSVR